MEENAGKRGAGVGTPPMRDLKKEIGSKRARQGGGENEWRLPGWRNLRRCVCAQFAAQGTSKASGGEREAHKSRHGVESAGHRSEGVGARETL